MLWIPGARWARAAAQHCLRLLRPCWPHPEVLIEQVWVPSEPLYHQFKVVPMLLVLPRTTLGEPLGQSLVTQSVVLGPAAWASCGILVEMQHLGLIPDLDLRKLNMHHNKSPGNLHPPNTGSLLSITESVYSNSQMDARKMNNNYYYSHLLNVYVYTGSFSLIISHLYYNTPVKPILWTSKLRLR